MENEPSRVCSFLFFSFFFLSIFFIKDLSKTIQDRNFIFGIHVDNDKLYRGIENEPSPVCSFLYLFFLYTASTTAGA